MTDGGVDGAARLQGLTGPPAYLRRAWPVRLILKPKNQKKITPIAEVKEFEFNKKSAADLFFRAQRAVDIGAEILGKPLTGCGKFGSATDREKSD